MIVKSILDTDLYKFTTSYAYMKLFPHAIGTFEFFDRDNTEYTEEFVQQLWIEISNFCSLKLTHDEQDYMTTHCRFIPPMYWEWLSGIRLSAGRKICDMCEAIKKSMSLTPTDGLGISNSDLDQIGAKSYYDVDRVLQTLTCKASPENDKLQDELTAELGPDVVGKITERRFKSRFKRLVSPIIVPREMYD